MNCRKTHERVRISSHDTFRPPAAVAPGEPLAEGLRQLRVSGTLALGQVAHVGPVSIRYQGHKIFIRFGDRGEIAVAPIDRHRAAIDAIGLVDLPVVFEAPPETIPLVRTGPGGAFARDLTAADLTPPAPAAPEVFPSVSAGA